ncbi:hypothetical protein MKZ38_008485 [Zalerion maritima]|uniref:Fork-head domain-containing protein n=1 Tax=Zalerion maritima TaxID=339359 RepID=A0AAD5WTX1_9PEZI|nr:hypothetical protein MKZ38_008485 [Zalerion maritima]
MAKPTRFDTAIEPLHIYQDDIFDQAAPIVSHAPMPSTTKSPRKALQPAKTNAIINPTSSKSGSGRSPLKPKSRHNSTPLNLLQPSKGNSKLNMVSIQPPSFNGQQTDSMQKKCPVMSRFKTVTQKPLASAAYLDSNSGKENSHPTIYPAPPAPSQFNLPLENYYQKTSGKRVLMEAAPIKEARPAKKIKLDTDVELPPHDSFPPVKDDGQKPPHSYATLIGMAILRSPYRRLTLSQIYKWISDSYSFYNAQDAGWQNSIRHNLSLNKAFIKQERPKDDKGKGNYWAILPGMEAQFVKEKPTRKSQQAAANLNSDNSGPPLRMEPPPPRASSAVQESGLPPAASKMALPKLSQINSTAAANEPSSDATIPCPISDLAVPEESIETKLDFDANLDFYSPLPAAIHSSPPIPKHIDTTRSGTPPPIMKALSSSVSRSNKRKLASMDDSGYISSLESSVMRPNQAANNMLTSEVDRPHSRRGRTCGLGTAEAEIRRIRSSSYDSPTKSRSHGLMPPSSSPYRNDSGQMLPPLTPAMKMRAPPRPPPSVSPNTNLRIHRDKVHTMLNSPLRRASVLAEEANTWSPAFNLDNTIYTYNEFNIENTDFDVFQDPLFANFDIDSPIKRSVRKPSRLERPHSTGALSDMSNSAQRKSITSVPFLKFPGQIESPNAAKFDTPSKLIGTMDSPGKLFNLGSPTRMPVGDENSAGDWLAGIEDFQGSEFLVDEITDFGLDILQGFEKIGGGAPSNSQPQVSTPTRTLQPRQIKPGLGRSYTTTF